MYLVTLQYLFDRKIPYKHDIHSIYKKRTKKNIVINKKKFRIQKIQILKNIYLYNRYKKKPDNGRTFQTHFSAAVHVPDENRDVSHHLNRCKSYHIPAHLDLVDEHREDKSDVRRVQTDVLRGHRSQFWDTFRTAIDKMLELPCWKMRLAGSVGDAEWNGNGLSLFTIRVLCVLCLYWVCAMRLRRFVRCS